MDEGGNVVDFAHEMKIIKKIILLNYKEIWFLMKKCI